jgi:hypothetical protein
MAEKHLIDQRALKAAKEFCEDFHLFEHEPSLAFGLDVINVDHPDEIDGWLFTEWLARVETFRAFHDEVPFPTVPEGLLDQGTITIGRQLANGAPVTLGAEVQHRLIYAPTGGGKSNFLAHIIRDCLESK